MFRENAPTVQIVKILLTPFDSAAPAPLRVQRNPLFYWNFQRSGGRDSRRRQAHRSDRGSKKL
jgi:hypothetical protein